MKPYMTESNSVFVLFIDAHPDLVDATMKQIEMFRAKHSLIAEDEVHKTSTIKGVERGIGLVLKRAMRSLLEEKHSLMLVLEGDETLRRVELEPLLNKLEKNGAGRHRDEYAVKAYQRRKTSAPVVGGIFRRLVAWGIRSEALEGIPFHRNTDGGGFQEQLWEELQVAGKRVAEIEVSVSRSEKPSLSQTLKHFFYSTSARSKRVAHELGLRWFGAFDINGPVSYPAKPSPVGSHSRLAAMVAPGSTALDVGCGQGYMASLLKDKGCVVDGVDIHISKGAEKYCRKVWRVDLEHGYGPHIKGPYDVVLMGDVLEHLRNPAGLVRDSRRILAPGGLLLCSTGNVAHWFMRLSLLLGEFNYTPKGILDRTHIHLFTRRTFRSLLQDEGFAIQSEDLSLLPLEEIFGKIVSTAQVDSSCFDNKNSGLKSSLVFTVDRARRMQHALARKLPGLFAYQIILAARKRDMY